MKFVRSIPTFFSGVLDEIKRVVWPSRAETINTTLTVLATVGAVMIVVGALDYGLTRVVEWLVLKRVN